MSSFLVTVLYPSAPNAKFDMEYYNAKHIPLTSAKWSKFGLKKYYVADLRGAPGPYSVQCTLVWDGEPSNLEKALAESGPEVMGDVANFSSEQPILLTGGIVNSN